MNKVQLLGRMVKDPEVKYSQSNADMAIAKYTLAVKRKFARQGEPDTDFINCVAFGKTGQFVEKYLKKGQMIAISGSIKVTSWEDPATNQKRWSTDIVVEDHYFCESKGNTPATPTPQTPQAPAEQGFKAIPDPTLDDLPF